MGTLVPDHGYQSLHVCTLDYNDNGADEGHIFATRPFIYDGVTYSDGQFDKIDKFAQATDTLASVVNEFQKIVNRYKERVRRRHIL